MALYDLVRDLPLVVERYELEGHEYPARADFLRKTTVIRLSGAGEEGLGEDVTYDGALQAAQQERGPVLPLVGEWTIESFSTHLGTVELFPEAPERHDFETTAAGRSRALRSISHSVRRSARSATSSDARPGR